MSNQELAIIEIPDDQAMYAYPRTLNAKRIA